jgi:hypothetical protein
MYKDLFQRYRDRLADVHDSDVDKLVEETTDWGAVRQTIQSLAFAFPKLGNVAASNSENSETSETPTTATETTDNTSTASSEQPKKLGGWGKINLSKITKVNLDLILDRQLPAGDFNTCCTAKCRSIAKDPE